MSPVLFHLASNPNLVHRLGSHQQDDAQAFKRFLFRHIEQALTDGWSNDGVSGGTRSESSSFELCTYANWMRLFTSIRELFESTSSTNKAMRQAHGMVRAHIDPDGKLSETRCKKCLPLATKYYEDGLPSKYTRHFHEKRVGSVRHLWTDRLDDEPSRSLAASNGRILRYLRSWFQLQTLRAAAHRTVHTALA